MNILYISDSYLDLSVFMSQVHSICNYHSKLNNVKLLSLCSHKDIKLDKPKDAKYELIKLYRYPKMFIPFVNKFRAFTISSKIKNEFEWADVIHCRGHVGSVFAINILKKFKLHRPIISDIRGAIVEEIESKQSLLAKFLSNEAKKLEEMVFKNIDYFFFVSNNMQTYYKEKYKFKQNSSVFPTIVNEDYFYKSDTLKKEYREKLNIKNRQAYIYVGGVDYWQNLDKILLKFNDINLMKPSDFFFIVLTNNPSWVYEFCKLNDINTENFYINSVSYSEVGKYLNASDFGVIIREENIINYVASPTKINEYLACDLKIIDNLDQIGVNNKFLEREYKPINKIVKEQNEIFVLLKKL